MINVVHLLETSQPTSQASRQGCTDADATAHSPFIKPQGSWTQFLPPRAWLQVGNKEHSKGLQRPAPALSPRVKAQAGWVHGQTGGGMLLLGDPPCKLSGWVGPV